MDVARLLGPVILDSAFEVGVRQHPELVEQGKSSVDGGGIASRYPLFDLASERRGADVARRRHCFHHDCSPLRGHAQTAEAKLGDDLFWILLRHATRVVAGRKCPSAAE
jgi:hypothetical protein